MNAPFCLKSYLDELLQGSGYSTDRAGDVGLQYVLLIVHDPVRGLVVGLQKLKGPSFLHGKLTFPGGKLEQGESPEEAATREIQEEAAVAIPVDAWKFVCRSSCVIVLAATSPAVLRARQCEEEPVFVMNVTRQLEYAARRPDLYVPDFIVTLRAALAQLA